MKRKKVTQRLPGGAIISTQHTPGGHEHDQKSHGGGGGGERSGKTGFESTPGLRERAERFGNEMLDDFTPHLRGVAQVNRSIADAIPEAGIQVKRGNGYYYLIPTRKGGDVEPAGLYSSSIMQYSIDSTREDVAGVLGEVASLLESDHPAHAQRLRDKAAAIKAGGKKVRNLRR